MGIGPMGRKSCYTNCNPDVKAPNPDPSMYSIISIHYYDNCTMVEVRYTGCTNFEGVKILVFSGHFEPNGADLDPHFSDNGISPIARFKPDHDGLNIAKKFCESF